MPPGFTPPPIICGYNTGQHMWVPACPSCVTITIDIDTANAATTRSEWFTLIGPESIKILCSDWWNLTMQVPRSMP